VGEKKCVVLIVKSLTCNHLDIAPTMIVLCQKSKCGALVIGHNADFAKIKIIFI
jgi:hypothetical protein